MFDINTAAYVAEMEFRSRQNDVVAARRHIHQRELSLIENARGETTRKAPVARRLGDLLVRLAARVGTTSSAIPNAR